MEKKTFFMAAIAALCAGFTLGSCTNDIEDFTSSNEQLTDPTHGTKLAITKVGTSKMKDVTRTTSTEVDVWATAPDKNIGVSVYSSAAGTEAMESGSTNMKWTYNTASSGWESQTPLNFFPGDEGYVTAYYPYEESADPEAISIDATKDYMYALIGDNKIVNYGDPQTTLQMHHANAQIRVNLVRRGYGGPGEVTAFSVKGTTLASSAKLNTLTGELSDFNTIPEIAGSTGTLAADVDQTPTAKINTVYEWFVPVNETSAPVAFYATVDGLKLRYIEEDMQFESGKRYTFNLAVTGDLSGKLVMTDVEVSPWADGNEVNEDLELYDDPYNGYEYVDLGLPSGLKWAKCNVGATSETDYGLYFQWGDTEGHAKDSGYAFTTANYTAKGLSALLGSDLPLSHDAAHINMGGLWRMPTQNEFTELCINSFAEWTEDYDGTGKAGVIFYSTTSNATGKGYYKGGTKWHKLTENSRFDSSQPGDFVAYTLATPHIFFPASGRLEGDPSTLREEGTNGTYWCSTVNASVNAGCRTILDKWTIIRDRYTPSLGYAVRAVCEE